ncbi:MAG: GH32 C-terminal domain-containing protein [Pirellulales bacterium]|nr:GH32 C-terminal domain-containing protein [Pirellulales bacterium]
MEVFSNGRQAMAQRIYPTRGDSQEIRVLPRERLVHLAV